MRNCAKWGENVPKYEKIYKKDGYILAFLNLKWLAQWRFNVSVRITDHLSKFGFMTFYLHPHRAHKNTLL